VVQPLRVVLDGRGRVTSGPLMDTSRAPTLIFTSKDCPHAVLEHWETSGVQVCVVPYTHSDVGAAAAKTAAMSCVLDLNAVLEELGKRGVLQLMVEGGAVLGGSLLQQDMVDELRVYVGATLLGSSSKRWAQTKLTDSIKDAKFWHLCKVSQLDDDICLQYEKQNMIFSRGD